MQLRIFNNLSALTDQRPLGVHNERLSKTTGQVASENLTENSSEEATATALSERLRSDTNSLQQDARNADNSLARIQATRDTLEEQSDIVIRLRELASKAATKNISQDERDALSREFDQLRNEFDRIANSANSQRPLPLDNAALASDLESQKAIQVDLESGTLAVNSSDLRFADTNISTSLNASSAMDALAQALDKLSAVKTFAGSLQARLEKAMENLNVSIENLTAAESQSSGADIASDLTRFTRDQILAHSAAAMVGQANLIPQGVFELIEGL